MMIGPGDVGPEVLASRYRELRSSGFLAQVRRLDAAMNGGRRDSVDTLTWRIDTSQVFGAAHGLAMFDREIRRASVLLHDWDPSKEFPRPLPIRDGHLIIDEAGAGSLDVVLSAVGVVSVVLLSDPVQLLLTAQALIAMPYSVRAWLRQHRGTEQQSSRELLDLAGSNPTESLVLPPRCSPCLAGPKREAIASSTAVVFLTALRTSFGSSSRTRQSGPGRNSGSCSRKGELMSFDQAIWVGEKPANSLEARQTFDRLMSEFDETEPADPRLETCKREITARYSDGLLSMVTGSVWATAPLAPRGRLLYMNLSWGTSDKVLGFIARTAAKHGLVCFDPQTSTVVEAGDPVPLYKSHATGYAGFMRFVRRLRGR